MPISDYSDLLDGQKYYEGQLIFAEPAYIFTGINADSVILPFGRALVKGTGDMDLILPVNGSSVLMGIAFLSDTFEKRTGYSLDADGNFGYPLKNVVSYIKRGTVAVKVDSAVVAGAPAFWRHTAAGAERKGTFRADADTSDAVQIPQSRFMASAASGSIVPLSINLP